MNPISSNSSTSSSNNTLASSQPAAAAAVAASTSSAHHIEQRVQSAVRFNQNNLNEDYFKAGQELGSRNLIVEEARGKEMAQKMLSPENEDDYSSNEYLRILEKLESEILGLTAGLNAATLMSETMRSQMSNMRATDAEAKEGIEKAAKLERQLRGEIADNAAALKEAFEISKETEKKCDAACERLNDTVAVLQVTATVAAVGLTMGGAALFEAGALAVTTLSTTTGVAAAIGVRVLTN